MSAPPVTPVAVLDSSVLVPAWSRFVLQRLAAQPGRRYSPVWSEWIIAETWRVLAWRRLADAGRADAETWRELTRSANRMLRQFLQVMTLVSLRGYIGPEPWPDLRDEDDAPIWQTAVVAGAQYVVSHNLADFPPLAQGRHVYGGIEYLTAVEFVEDVLGEDAAVIYGAALPPGAPIRSRRAP
jgi:hypothetical protein